MKKTLTIMTLLAGAVSVYSQGTVAMNDYNSFFGIQVFVPQTSGNNTTVSYGGFAGLEEMGNTANSYNHTAGNQVYATSTGLGVGYDVTLLYAAGTGDALSTLVPTTSAPITTWYTGSTATAKGGFWNTSAVDTLAGVTGSATVAIAAWKNSGNAGSANTLAQAQLDGYAWGISALGNIAAVGFGSTPTPNLPGSITDFSLVSTPEPSTIALGVIGASALLFRRRK